MNREIKQRIRNGDWYYYMLPVIGWIFLLIYLQLAASDVVYTDYMRLINSYLPDVYNPAPYLHADVLTRLPINYLQRIVNVTFFSYSTMFDMVLGVTSLFLMALVLAEYAVKFHMRKSIYTIMMLVVFSLNKWEMYTNGSGWVHFLAFALFFWHYRVFDRFMLRKAKKRDGLLLILLPIGTILLVAGPYSGTYALTLLLTYAVIIWGGAGVKEEGKQAKTSIAWISRLWREGKKHLVPMLSIIIPLGLYILSRIHSVEEHAGATKLPMAEVARQYPFLFIRMLIKSFASMLIGGEFFQQRNIPDGFVFMLGLMVIGMYVYAFWLTCRWKIYEKTMLPLLLLLSGVFNHMLITLSRWIFLRENYVMSSRYALQFQVGLVGMLLTIALAYKKEIQTSALSRFLKKKATIKKEKTVPGGYISAMICILLLLSQLVFYRSELDAAPYRKKIFEDRKEAALHYENLSDEEIKTLFQYKSPEKTKEALRILKENELNIFSGSKN